MKKYLSWLFNLLGIPSVIMSSRALMARYFDYKYKYPDPYKISSQLIDDRYLNMLDLLKTRQYQKAVDLGCGEGVFSEMLLQIAQEVDGIDISKSAIARAKTTYSERENLKFHNRDLVNREWNSGYDLAVCAEMLYYLTIKQFHQVASKITNCLVPGGHLLLGNIKVIGSDCGWFQNKIRGEEINRFFIESGDFFQIACKDRGKDLLLLLEKRNNTTPPKPEN